MTEEKDPKIGKYYIGTFNPNDREDVSDIKGKCSDLIDAIIALDNYDERRKAIAITHVEQAAMMAVKSIFSRELVK